MVYCSRKIFDFGPIEQYKILYDQLVRHALSGHIPLVDAEQQVNHTLYKVRQNERALEIHENGSDSRIFSASYA